MPDQQRRDDAVRDLEGSIAELVAEFRRTYAAAAEAASPGMLPATYKVLSSVNRAGTITLSALAEKLLADKGQVSRSVTELEGLGFVARTGDPADGRIKLIAVTDEGRIRLARARASYDARFHAAMQEWPIDSIEQLSGLLRELTAAAGGAREA